MKLNSVLFLAVLVLSAGAGATTVSQFEARAAAKSWLRERLGGAVSAEVLSARTLALTNGVSVHEMEFSRGGTAYMSTDDRLPPVVAFTAVSGTRLDEGSPLRALLLRDLRLRSLAAATNASLAAASSGAWKRLIVNGFEDDGLAASGRNPPVESVKYIDDLRVAPLLGSQWGQGEVDGRECFNSRTPSYSYTNTVGELVERRAVCGCVATAMAQLMRYWEHPSAEIEPFANALCKIPYGVKCLGRDGEQDILSSATSNAVLVCAGEGLDPSVRFDWASMPLVPEDPLETECAAVGALTYACGVAVGMEYGVGSSGIPASQSLRIPQALRGTFGYANARLYVDSTGGRDAVARHNAVFSNLDAGCPVLLGIMGGVGGHEVVADGYGYAGGVEYTHLNMGWYGQNDVWYNLPSVDVGDNPESFTGFDQVLDITYNVFPEGGGEIISGRTLGLDGLPVTGAVVTVRLDGADVSVVTSSVSGVWAAKVPAGAAYDVYADCDRLGILGDITTGSVVASADSSVVGNLWGLDIVMRDPAVVAVSGGGSVTNGIFAWLDTAVRDLRRVTAEDLTLRIVAAGAELRRSVVIRYDCTIESALEGGAPAVLERAEDADIFVRGDATVVGFSNILFSAASDYPVHADDGGTIGFAGAVSASETLAVSVASNSVFILAGPISGGIDVDHTGLMGESNFFGIAVCDFATAEANAGKLLNPYDLDLVGEAVETNGVIALRWIRGGCDPEAAAASWTDSAGTHYVRSFLRALEGLGGSGAVTLLKKESLDAVFEVGGDIVIGAENGATLVPENGGGFHVPSGTSLTLMNIVVEGGRGTSAVLDVDGGTLTLGAGAVLDDLEVSNPLGKWGAVYVHNRGGANFLEGSAITGCASLSPGNSNSNGGYGGAVFVATGASAFLDGVKITGCRAQVYGGGIYADTGAKVSVQGTTVVDGNTAASGTDNIRFNGAAKTKLALAGEFSGLVGIRYSTPASVNEDGGAFLALGDGVSAATAVAAAKCFSNDAHSDASAVAGGLSLVWNVPADSDVPEEIAETGLLRDEDGFITNAVARTVYADGETHYWKSFSDAVESLTAKATIEMLNDDILVKDVEFGYPVTVTTAADAVVKTAGFVRISRCQGVLTVPAGITVTLDGIEFIGNTLEVGVADFARTRLFWVRGGTLVMRNSSVFGVLGSTDRAAAAVVVNSSGCFRLTDGSWIYMCENSFEDADVNAGAAAALIVEGEDSSAVLQNGVIYANRARKTGGVFVGNGAVIDVGGSVYIGGNTDLEDVDANMVIADSSDLRLQSPLEGGIGCMKGVLGDRNVFGTVSDRSAEAIHSATNFVNDETGSFGTVATNAAGTVMKLVWMSAFYGGETSCRDKQGVDWFIAGEYIAPTPPPFTVVTNLPTAIAFRSITETDSGWRLVLTNLVRGANYRIYSAGTLESGFPVDGEPVLDFNAEEDGPFAIDFPKDGTQRFWRATGRTTYITNIIENL